MGYGLLDSPVALCTWIAEKFCESTAGHPEDAISRDRLLDDVMLYWLPGTGASSARLYWESYSSARHDIVKVPTAITLFPRELARLPRSWLERRFVDLRYWSEPEAGGHFASLEVPELWIHEVRRAFRALR
jgi:hypothetical protein